MIVNTEISEEGLSRTGIAQKLSTMADVHGGRWLRNFVRNSGRSQIEFAADIGVAPVTLRSWFYKASPSPRPNVLIALARQVGMPVNELRKQLGLAEDAALDRNVDLAGAITLRAEVPFFDLPVAAGNWTDVTEQMQVFDPLQIDRGLFRVRIHGDSMHPVVPDGMIVEFRTVRLGRDSWPVGKPCYVQLSTGEATFKILADVTESTVILKAANTRKYPKPLIASLDEVCRVAVAESIVTRIGDNRNGT